MDSRFPVGKKQLTFTILLSAFISAVAIVCGYLSDRDKIVFCATDRGQATLIHVSGRNIVVNTGSAKQIIPCLTHNLPFYNKHIDYLIVTNAKAENYLGIQNLRLSYKIQHLYAPAINTDGFAAIAADLQKDMTTVVTLEAATTIKVKNFTLTLSKPYKLFSSGRNRYRTIDVYLHKGSSTNLSYAEIAAASPLPLPAVIHILKINDYSLPIRSINRLDQVAVIDQIVINAQTDTDVLDLYTSLGIKVKRLDKKHDLSLSLNVL